MLVNSLTCSRFPNPYCPEGCFLFKSYGLCRLRGRCVFAFNGFVKLLCADLCRFLELPKPCVYFNGRLFVYEFGSRALLSLLRLLSHLPL